MSWKTINNILGIAAIDKIFELELLKNPLEAVQKRGYELTEEERASLTSCKVTNLAELSQHLLNCLSDSNT